jgi:hypothetical protein
MSESEQWRAMRERYARFRETELGRLFTAYDHATIAYWQRDGDETVSDARLKALDEACRKAANSFLAKLMDLANV